MVTSNQAGEQCEEYCKYNANCESIATKTCHGCQQRYCVDHYLEHHTRLEEHFDYVRQTQYSLIQKLNSLISQLTADDMLDLMQEIYEFQTHASEIDRTVQSIQEQLQNLINEDKQDLEKTTVIVTHELDSEQDNDLESDIECLRKDIEALRSEIETLSTNAESNHSLRATTSSTSDRRSARKNSYLRALKDLSRLSFSQPVDDNTVLSHLILKQMSPSIVDLDESELTSTDEEMDTSFDDDTIGVIDTNTTATVRRKIRLSNNIVKWLRGPIKVMIDGTLHAAEMYAQDTPISDTVVQAIDRGLAAPRQSVTEQSTNNNSLKPLFAEITADWIYEGKNADSGFSSASSWMRDLEGRRILVKTEEHPMCAANERLAYTLGRLLGLSVNEVQIAIYQKALVTLHTDVTRENEKIVTFMDLPKQMRRMLLKDPTMESMDLFDHITQNVDRNPRNILITMPKSTGPNDEPERLKIHLIDHSSCFGMGKLNIISILACKLRSDHLAVIKFDPIERARKFEQYLSKLPSTDRLLIRKTLNRLATITDEQVDQVMDEVKDLLSASQYDRIRDVLRRQRDVAKRYTIQWGIFPRASLPKQHELIVHF